MAARTSSVEECPGETRPRFVPFDPKRLTIFPQNERGNIPRTPRPRDQRGEIRESACSPWQRNAAAALGGLSDRLHLRETSSRYSRLMGGILYTAAFPDESYVRSPERSNPLSTRRAASYIILMGAGDDPSFSFFSHCWRIGISLVRLIRKRKQT